MNTAQVRFDIEVNSEIGELEGVLLHTPGLEIENMTPVNAERALYSDILNLNVAKKEWKTKTRKSIAWIDCFAISRY